MKLRTRKPAQTKAWHSEDGQTAIAFTTPGKEGKRGVEGMDEATILRALRNAGVQASDSGKERTPITKFDLYACGLSGHESSQTARKKLLHALDLPERMSANALLQALNVLYDREEFLRTYSNIGD